VYTLRCLVFSNHPSQPTISQVYQDTQQLHNYQRWLSNSEQEEWRSGNGGSEYWEDVCSQAIYSKHSLQRYYRIH
jgi:hypothetical protein